MAATVERDTYFSFWNKYSSHANMSAMMLNNNADQLEPFDRADIMASLPDFTGMDVVDVGAGIGRFTGTFAERAKHVVSSDFIESFIEKNKERNARFDNIAYEVKDAVGLNLPTNSADLVFTNWLLMYLNEAECAQFLRKAISWVRPGGYMHVRESCTEPSTGKAATGSLHSTKKVNPTHYRYSSVYLQLLKTLRYVDENGFSWRFDVLWSKSVPTYIERVFNWRQVHWLVRKVPAQGGGLNSERALISAMGQWKIIQDHTDFMLSKGASSWTDSVLAQALNKVELQKDLPLFGFSPRIVSPFVFLNSHAIAHHTDRNIWAVETNPFFYRHMLSECVEKKDRRVQYGWNQDLSSAVEALRAGKTRFSAVLATELIMANDDAALMGLNEILVKNGTILTLEPAASPENFNETIAHLLPDFVEILSVEDVSAAAQASTLCNEQKQAFDSPNQPCWLLVHARLL